MAAATSRICFYLVSDTSWTGRRRSRVTQLVSFNKHLGNGLTSEATVMKSLAFLVFFLLASQQLQKSLSCFLAENMISWRVLGLDES